MNVRECYDNWSRSYDSDANATRDLDRVVMERMLGSLRFESIVEAGCGTGKNTGFLAGIGAKVMAMDFSPSMLEKARSKSAHLANVSLSVADITGTWPCPTDSADLVTCNLVLEHIEHLQLVFAEAARVLQSGGKFFVCELHPFRQYAGGVANFRRENDTVQIPAFVHHVSDFLDAAEACGFRLISFKEWWGEQDEGKAPRLVSFFIERVGG